MRRTIRTSGLSRAVAQTSTSSSLASRTLRSSPLSTSAKLSALDTEKWRRRIFGKEKPPGPADPYTGPSQVERSASDPATNETDLASESSALDRSKKDWDFSGYVPAEDWSELEHVGGSGEHIKGRVEPSFAPFVRESRRVTDPYELTAMLHRAVVEVFALQAAGKGLSLLGAGGVEPDITAESSIVRTDDGMGAALVAPKGVTVEQIANALLAWDETAVKTNPSDSEADVAADRSTVDALFTSQMKKDLLDETAEKGNPSVSEAIVAADRSHIDPLKGEDYKELVESWDPIWLDVALVDSEVKFAVTKRITQLTNIRLSDASINSVQTVSDLLSHLATPPKPKKLLEALAQKQELFDLPNVKIHPRRVTKIDKQKEVGRWKLIEAEFRERGLPVHGVEDVERRLPEDKKLK